MSTDPIAAAARGHLPQRSTRRLREVPAERNVLVRLATPLHRRFRAAANAAELHQSDLYRAMVLLYLENDGYQRAVNERAEMLRDA